jgi:hypothetical protein
LLSPAIPRRAKPSAIEAVRQVGDTLSRSWRA